MKQLVIEVTYEDVNLCMADGSEVTNETLLTDLADCCAGGDVEPACQYILDNYEIDWRIVRCISRDPFEFESLPATEAEITASARSIYLGSETDFTDQDIAKQYLIWQAASDITHDC